ncbi:transcription repressor OFP15-like [Cucurbita moschata]|uniref:Transcription repressor n=1 Tax=Cucurbita moschata TaxID=3662 RepID=A0A6J1HDQ4_CUCMO|nr:transcription repressor OFP15-like [Cucurbita moschata]
MGKKLKKLPNLVNKSPWLWRSCTQSRTLSFRISNDIFIKTINSAYEEDDMSDDEQIEALLRGLSLRQGNRLFLELEETNSIMAAGVAGNCEVPFKESVAMAMDSKEPYLEFKKSMEEMVEAHGLKDDWKGLEMLLSWYLKANSKTNHGFIIGAFVDLMVGFGDCSPNSPSSSSSSSSCSSSSSLLCSSNSYDSSFGGPNCSTSSSSSTHVLAIPSLSSLFEDKEEDIEKNVE